MKIWLTITSVFFFFLTACSGEQSETLSPKPKENTPVSNEEETEQDADTSTEETETPDETPVQLISEARARDILAGSCLFAGCHANAADTLLNSAEQSKQSLESGVMPPPNQSRYTIGDLQKAQLIKFFENKLAQAELTD